MMTDSWDIDCPVCGTEYEIAFRKKAIFGECPYCGHRSYISLMGMERAMEKVKADASKTKGKAAAT